MNSRIYFIFCSLVLVLCTVSLTALCQESQYSINLMQKSPKLKEVQKIKVSNRAHSDIQGYLIAIQQNKAGKWETIALDMLNIAELHRSTYLHLKRSSTATIKWNPLGQKHNYVPKKGVDYRLRMWTYDKEHIRVELAVSPGFRFE